MYTPEKNSGANENICIMSNYIPSIKKEIRKTSAFLGEIFLCVNYIQKDNL